MKLLSGLLKGIKFYVDSIQSWIESKLEKDKLEHFLICTFLLVPISMRYKDWETTLICSIVIALLKEASDYIIRKHEWSWSDIKWTIIAGGIQSLLVYYVAK